MKHAAKTKTSQKSDYIRIPYVGRYSVPIPRLLASIGASIRLIVEPLKAFIVREMTHERPKL